MATEAQIAANRTNSQASTGPRTAEGKAQSFAHTETERPGLIPTVPTRREAPMVRNAVSSGLFTRKNCVQPQERDEYNNLYTAMWNNLSPAGPVEEMFATEIVRGAWRLRRCAIAEDDLSRLVERDVRGIQEKQQAQDPETEPSYRAWDPVIYDHRALTQAAIDRARSQTAGIVRRATADLHRLQNERLYRAATFPEYADASRFGLATFADVVPKINSEAGDQLLAAITPAVPPVDAAESIDAQIAHEADAPDSRVVGITNRSQLVPAPNPETSEFHPYPRPEPTKTHPSAA